MRLFPHIALASALLAVGCQSSPTTQVASTAGNLSAEARALAAAEPDAVVVSAGTEAGPVAKVTVMAPGYKVQVAPINATTGTNAVHKWVVADITKYVVKLQDGGSTGASYADIANLAAAEVVVGTSTKAFFTNLIYNHKYRASVQVWGHIKANTLDPDVQLNTTSFASGEPNTDAARAFFDFTGTNDVKATQSATVPVQLDGVAFNGSADVTVTAPNDGVYVAPSASPTTSVQ